MNIAVKDTQLYVVRHGRGVPMLLMHGGLGWDHTYFRPWLDALSEHVELVYYDHRGNGRSAPPDDWGSVSHDTWVEDAEALRERLGLERIILFGHSYGGFLAQEYALRYPDRLIGLILCCTAPALDFAPVVLANAEARGTEAQFEAVVEVLSTSPADDAALARTMMSIFPLYFHRYDSATGAEVLKQMHLSAAAFDHAFARCLPTFSTTDRLHEIAAPTLIVAGAHDWIMPPAQGAARIHGSIPHSEIRVLPKSGHFPWIEQSDEFLGAVTSFVASLLTRGDDFQ